MTDHIQCNCLFIQAYHCLLSVRPDYGNDTAHEPSELGNKPWKKEFHHPDEPWIRSLEECFNGGKERGRERERGDHEIEGRKRERS